MIFVNNSLSNIWENGVLIAAHRGTYGGNIIQNTISAFENALLQGADILEIDVAKTINGDFFCFHIGQEPGLLRVNQRLDAMTTEQVLNYRLYNSIQEITSQKINTLDDVLDHFKGKCLINIDRSWLYWEDIISYLDKKNMNDQIILKSPPEKSFLKLLEDKKTQIMYMPIIRKSEDLEQSLLYKINLVAAEAVFPSDTCEISQMQFIEKAHAKKILLWVNAVTLDDNTILSGGHDDNFSILQNMRDGWGWLIKHGFDIIQTDWPMLLKSYMHKI